MYSYKTGSLNSLPLYLSDASVSTNARIKNERHSTRVILICASVIILSLWQSTNFKAPLLGLQWAPSLYPAHLVKAQNGAIASENARCSLIGVDVLKDGGTAVDAAVASVLCVGVVNMFSSGIGGGGFMVVRLPPKPNATSEAWTIDFRETAPRQANSTMFVANPRLAIFGGLAVAIPGELRGLEEAHRRWGRLPWSRLVQPSVRLAQGWEVDKELGRRIPWYKDLMLNNSDWKAIFAPGGALLKEGQFIRRTNLSQTLATIADHGADAFYKGHIAESLIRKINSTGGILSSSDLEDYHPKIEPALEGTYNGRRVMTTHAPSSGPGTSLRGDVVDISSLLT